jgi:polysaccharide biosynthesis transport protein
MVASRPLPLTVAPEKELGYGQIFTAIARRKHWLVIGVLSGLAVAGALSLRQTPIYSSSMQLLIESIYQGKGQSNTRQTDEITDSSVQVDSATQISFLQSSGLIKKAMQDLKAEYPEFNADDAGSVAAFKRGLSITQLSAVAKKGDPTKIFQISYQADNGTKSQKVLNALQKVYLEYNREQQELRLTKGLGFINQQLPEIGRKLQQSESKLENFRRSQDLIDPKLEAQRQSEMLSKAEQEIQTNASQIRELRSRQASLQQQLPTGLDQTQVMARLTQSSRYQSLLSEIQRTELALVQQRLRFKDETPYVRQILDQRQQQMGLLQVESQRVLGGTAVVGEGELLQAGQLTPQDIASMTQLAEAGVALQAAEARYYGLTQGATQLRANMKRFPQVLAEYGRLEPEVELNRDTLRQLLKARQELGMEIARGSFDWQIVEEAQLGFKTNPPATQSLLLGAIAGLFLGGIVAFARESADDAVHTSDDLKRQLPVPMLGMVPSYGDLPRNISVPFGRSVSEPSAPMMQQFVHWQPFRESLDLIYQNLQLLNGDGMMKSVVVTSALAGEGKSTFALGLAISAARLHRRVLLIDGDLRSPSLHTMLGLPNEVGLANLLADDSPIPLIQNNTDESEYGNLAVLTAGTGSVDPAKLLSSQRLRRLISTFEKAYDLVIVDAPPMLGLVDTMLLSSRCSGVVMVGRIGKVTRSELTQAAQNLGQLNLIGVVANDVPAKVLPPTYETAVT